MICNTLDEINFIIKLCDNLIECLEFINKNCFVICDILEKEKEKNKDNKVNFQLFLRNVDKDNTIDNIYTILSEIVEKIKEKNYSIINHEKLFVQLFNLYKDKTIEELCKLKKIINLFDKKNFDINLLENYYNLIHKKGMILIQNDKLNIQEIINFVKKQENFRNI